MSVEQLNGASWSYATKLLGGLFQWHHHLILTRKAQ